VVIFDSENTEERGEVFTISQLIMSSASIKLVPETG